MDLAWSYFCVLDSVRKPALRSARVTTNFFQRATRCGIAAVSISLWDCVAEKAISNLIKDTFNSHDNACKCTSRGRDKLSAGGITRKLKPGERERGLIRGKNIYIPATHPLSPPPLPICAPTTVCFGSNNEPYRYKAPSDPELRK